MRYLSIYICLILVTIPALAIKSSNEWQATLQETIKIQAAKGCEYRKIDFQSSNNSKDSFTAYVAHFAANSYQAELVDQPVQDPNKFTSIAKIRANKGAIVAVNGGFFTKEFTANGLSIFNGKTATPFKKFRSPVLAGLLIIDNQAEITFSKSDAFATLTKDKINYGLQAGPFLINPDGKLSDDMLSTGMITLQNTKHTVVALSTERELLIISTSAGTLKALSECLIKYPQLLGVKKIAVALSLDGGRSAAFSLQLPQMPLNLVEGWPVRNSLTVSLK